jgi:hypothetical protein
LPHPVARRQEAAGGRAIGRRGLSVLAADAVKFSAFLPKSP